jgi:hypothetical protein
MSTRNFAIAVVLGLVIYGFAAPMVRQATGFQV